MSPYVNRTRPRVPTELTVPMSAVSTPRARGGLCLAAGICPGWVEAGWQWHGQTGAPPWISLFCTDARPGSKPRTTHPVHLWLIKCTEAGPGWSPVPARLGLCGTPLRTSLRHACDSFTTCIRLLFRTDTNDLTGGMRRGKGAVVTSHTASGAHFRAS